MKTTARYFIAVNQYRGESNHGFANTWDVMECRNRKHQIEILRDGLEVNDASIMTESGQYRPCLSTMGIRLATAFEIRKAKRDEQNNGYPIPKI